MRQREGDAQADDNDSDSLENASGDRDVGRWSGHGRGSGFGMPREEHAACLTILQIGACMTSSYRPGRWLADAAFYL